MSRCPIQRIVSVWIWLWFRPGPARPMGLLRIVVAGLVLLRHLPAAWQDLHVQAGLPAAFADPAPLLRLLGLSLPLPAWAVAPLVGGTAVTALATLIGWRPRWCAAATALGYGICAGAASSWGHINHESLLLFHLLVVLALAPGAEAASLDRWRASRNAGWRAWLDGDTVCCWGERLALALLMAVYLAAGIAKLRHGGLDWCDGGSLQFYLGGGSPAGQQYFFPDPAALPGTTWRDGIGLDQHAYFCATSGIGDWLATQPWLLGLMAGGAVAFQCAAPLILLGSFCRNAYLLVAVLFHATIGQLMGLGFFDYQMVCLALVDWPALARGLQRWRVRQPGPLQP